VVREILNEYLESRYELVEAKGWKSLPTTRDFHGWHGDAWYDQKRIHDIPREVKLGFYLTDVKSGAFNYVVGSHRKQHPRRVRDSELQDVPPSGIVEVMGAAGTAFVFDTSGIHRQGVPMLEERHAIFLNYHDPDVPLQQEDVEYYRYHPLLLNAAFLGKLSDEEQRILGFGNKTNYVQAFDRTPRHAALQTMFRRTFTMKLHADAIWQRVLGRLRRMRKQ
jgi:ectoine hydroxylase-related dioxygenase (phytanoyl-CoA dioxygenase family)